MFGRIGHEMLVDFVLVAQSVCRFVTVLTTRESPSIRVNAKEKTMILYAARHDRNLRVRVSLARKVRHK